MKTHFFCPKCRGYLSVGNRVIFTIKKKGWSGGLLLLSPELGDYTYEHHTSFEIDSGEQLEFHCPICNFDFSVEGTENLARVLMREGDGEEFYVVFSKKEGERSTYKLSEVQIEEVWGEHAAQNIDFISAALLK